MNAYTVASPCIDICKIDEATQRCMGCDRTIDEITRWSRMDDDAKQAVIDDIVRRKRSQKNDSSQTESTKIRSPQTTSPQKNSQ